MQDIYTCYKSKVVSGDQIVHCMMIFVLLMGISILIGLLQSTYPHTKTTEDVIDDPFEREAGLRAGHTEGLYIYFLEQKGHSRPLLDLFVPGKEQVPGIKYGLYLQE